MGGRGEARAQLGAPARPPREPTAARELVELGRPASTRPIYSPGAAPRQGKAHRGRGQSADPPGSPGNTARRLADVRRFLGLSLVAANFFSPGEGAGRAARASGQRADCGPLWVLLGGGGGKVPLFSAFVVKTLESTSTFCDPDRATLDVPFPVRSCWADRHNLYLPLLFLLGARELQNATILR